MEEAVTYAMWVQPWFAPPAALFGPVWSVLYLLIAVSYTLAFRLVIRGDYGKFIAVPLLLNLVANLAFTPIQFGLQNLWLASLDIILVLGTIVWSMVLLRRERWFVWMQVPYLGWVLFATVLQFSITYLNW